MDKLKHVKPSKEDAINYIREFYKYNSNINGAVVYVNIWIIMMTG